MTEKELLRVKKQIEDAKQKTSELKGEQTSLLKRLKVEWDCGSVEEAIDKLEELKQKALKIKKQIETKTNALIETYFEEGEE